MGAKPPANGLGSPAGYPPAICRCSSDARTQPRLTGSIAFEEDPDFGYEVAATVPGLEDEEKLRPRLLYERQGRADEYDRIVETLKTDRVAHLQRFTQLSEEIIKAVG